MNDEKIIYTGGDAFPTLDSSFETNNNDFKHVSSSGMTLRDYFAAKVLPAVFEKINISAMNCPKNYHDVAAREAYNMADAMLKARGHQ